MIKWAGKHTDGLPVYGFGLSAGNVERLRAGEPIFFDARLMGLEGYVVIHYGETEQAMEKWFRENTVMPPEPS